MASGSFYDLVTFALNSIGSLAVKSGASGEQARAICQAIFIGDGSAARAILANLTWTERISFEDRSRLSDSLVRLASLVPGLMRDSVERAILDQARHELTATGSISESMAPSIAYNLYEAAYHFATIADRPALELARKLRALSNPDFVDQHHGAIWRSAVENLRHACEKRTDWLSALDGLELALACPVQNEALQLQLYDQLKRQIICASGTPINDLILIVPVQVPAACVPPLQREAAMKMLAKLQLGERDHSMSAAELELWANIGAQITFDDMRQGLMPPAINDTSVKWHDVTMRHARLASAVPVGESLVTDINRTGIFLLDLTHEIGHAFVLLGPIGYHQAACRSAVHYLEFVLIAGSGDESIDPENIDTIVPLRVLPNTPAALSFAEAQLAAALNAAVAQSTWTPWLEGVSVYLELLCDPKDDPNEIMAVHECVRSLIDFSIRPTEEETIEDFTQRLGDEISSRFDEFLSKSLRKHSRFQHIGYFSGGDQSSLYSLGYLVVRSVVARWEATLGRRIKPIFAAKLLLNATQGGTFGAIPPATSRFDEFQAACRQRFLEWLQSLASLSKEAIENFLLPVARSERGVQWFWREGIPTKVEADPAGAVNIHEQYISSLTDQMVSLTTGYAGESTPSSPSATDTIGQLFKAYLELNSLLPIGADNARLLFLDTSGLVGLCLRTYVGKPETDEVALETTSDPPRYSHRFWRAETPKDEVANLRKLCGLTGSARVAASRIVDLAGHPLAPGRHKRTSYTCFFLGSAWSRVTPHMTEADLSSKHPEFTALLRRRLNPPAFYRDEENTVASLDFLIARMNAAHPRSAVLAEAAKFNALEMSLKVANEAAAAAFMEGDAEALKQIFQRDMTDAANRHAIARYLYWTGLGEAIKKEELLERLPVALQMLRTEGHSGVVPFGEKR